MQRDLARTDNVDLAAGASGTVVRITRDETRGYDVYLKGAGLDLSPTSNEDHATFRLRVDGVPRYPYERVQTRFASSALPLRFDVPYYLGQGVEVEWFGEMGGGATGTTTMVGTLLLILTEPGKSPRIGG